MHHLTCIDRNVNKKHRIKVNTSLNKNRNEKGWPMGMFQTKD
jgi:hypothetical protein